MVLPKRNDSSSSRGKFRTVRETLNRVTRRYSNDDDKDNGEGGFAVVASAGSGKSRRDRDKDPQTENDLGLEHSDDDNENDGTGGRGRNIRNSSRIIDRSSNRSTNDGAPNPGLNKQTNTKEEVQALQTLTKSSKCRPSIPSAFIDTIQIMLPLSQYSRSVAPSPRRMRHHMRLRSNCQRHGEFIRQCHGAD